MFFASLNVNDGVSDGMDSLLVPSESNFGRQTKSTKLKTTCQVKQTQPPTH